MMHHTTIKHVKLEYSYIFKHKNPGCNNTHSKKEKENGSEHENAHN